MVSYIKGDLEFILPRLNYRKSTSSVGYRKNPRSDWTRNMNISSATFMLSQGSPLGKKRRRVCVTGGAGFIGSHLCERLLSEGAVVFALDNFYTGRRSNVEHLQDQERFILVEHDITQPIPDDLPAFDEMYNLACPASPAHYQAEALKTLLTCSTGTMNVLTRAARDHACVFHASTSEIYGDPEIHPQPESYWGNVNTIGPRSCYDEGKRFSETLMMEFGARHDLRIRMARIFNTYGPRMQPDDGRVVSNFILQALKGEDITIYGDGSQTRSFCYCDDLVEGIIRLTRSTGAVPVAVNLGNPSEIAVGALAQIVTEMTGSSSKIVNHPLPTDDPRRRKPDISLASSLFSWIPEVTLHLGLQRTIAYFRNELQSGTADQEILKNSLELA